MEPQSDWPAWLIALYIIFGGGFFSGAYGFLKWYLPWRAKQIKDGPKDHFSSVLEKRDDLYQSMEELRRKNNCDRVCIVKAHNGGSILTVKNAIYSSIQYESFSRFSLSSNGEKPLSPIKDQWQKVMIDEEHVTLLRRLAVEDHLLVDVSELRDATALKDAYEAGGVKKVFFHKLHSEKGGFYYLSMTVPFEDFDPDAEWRNNVRIFLNQIRPFFEDKELFQ